MVAHIGDGSSLQNRDIVRCIFLGVSTYNYPTSGEAVLIREQALRPGWELTIRRYLFLKHNRIRVKVEENGDGINTLRVKRSVVSEIEHMIGNYKVINYDPRGTSLLISRFFIDKDYSAGFETHISRTTVREQVCLIEVSNVMNKRLCISTHPKEGTGIISYVMINMASTNEGISEGAFCGVGGENNALPAFGPIVLLRTNEKKFKMERISGHDIQAVIKARGDEKLYKAFLRLNQIRDEGIR